MDKMKEMMAKKKGKEMSDAEKKAKLGVLGHMKKMAEDAMTDNLHGMKKVSVASDSKEGLEEGLEKAKEIISSKEQDEMVEDAEDGNQVGDDLMAGGWDREEAEEDSEDEEMSSEELERKLQKLMAMKKKMSEKA